MDNYNLPMFVYPLLRSTLTNERRAIPGELQHARSFIVRPASGSERTSSRQVGIDRAVFGRPGVLHKLGIHRDVLIQVGL